MFSIDPWLAICVCVALLAGVYSLLMTLQAYEFRRFVRSRLRTFALAEARGDHRAYPARVAVICPCCGHEPDLAANLQALLEQDHPDFLLRFVVASQDDPAVEVIRQLRQQYPWVPSRLIIAGHAERGGQKVHNLLVATADLPAAVERLAFVDSDGLVQRHWLRSLVQHLERPSVAAATGYRWTQPTEPSLPQFLRHSLDAAVMTLMGPARHHVVWGGSWAIRSDVFVASQLRSAWQGTLSDDLVAARVLRPFGKVEFEPGAMVTTQLHGGWSETLDFVRRQFTIGRFYAPFWWSAGLVAVAIHALALWGSLALLLLAALNKAATIFALATLVSLFAQHSVRAWLRQNAAEQFAPMENSPAAAARRFDLLGSPLGGLLAGWGFLSSLCTSQIRWRGISYRLLPGGHAERLGTPLPSRPDPALAEAESKLTIDPPQSVVQPS